MTIHTHFTHHTAITHPIMLAPMGSVAGGELTAAVSNAGGLGMLGVGYGDLPTLKQELELVSQLTTKPWGVGFITWSLNDEIFDLVMQYSPAALMFSFGDPRPWVRRLTQRPTTLLCQVHDLAGAIEVHEQINPDFIVVQGTEAGGHGAGTRSTLPLIQAVKKRLPSAAIIAAGGIVDGASLAAALQLGADGVSMGSRFYASTESLAHPRLKQCMIESSGDNTIRTNVFDIVREINWPAGFTGRAINNHFVQRWHNHTQDLQQNRIAQQAAFFAAQQQAEPDMAIVWAGEGIDMITDIQPAATLTTQIAAEAEQLLKQAATFI